MRVFGTSVVLRTIIFFSTRTRRCVFLVLNLCWTRLAAEAGSGSSLVCFSVNADVCGQHVISVRAEEPNRPTGVSLYTSTYRILPRPPAEEGTNKLCMSRVSPEKQADYRAAYQAILSERSRTKTLFVSKVAHFVLQLQPAEEGVPPATFMTGWLFANFFRGNSTNNLGTDSSVSNSCMVQAI